MGVVGGCNLMLGPDAATCLSDMNFLSPDSNQLIRDTYHDGGIDIAATRYFESHGTGSQAGDPIEAAATWAAFNNHKPLYIGALKSNIGHLEGASGVAAIIKTILVSEKGLIPPNLWFERPNPKIPMDAWNFRLPIEPTLWPTDGLRRASVNSFGFGGANVVSFASSEDRN